MVASTLTGERARRAVPGGGPRRTTIGERVGNASRAGLGAGPAARSAHALAGGAAIFWDLRAERPSTWRRKAFRRWVELIRGHLAPIWSLEALAESFAREAAHPLTTADGLDLRDRLAASPLLAAYVVRWLELRNGEPLDGWRSIAG